MTHFINNNYCFFHQQYFKDNSGHLGLQSAAGTVQETEFLNC